jgi:hypothetical protein
MDSTRDSGSRVGGLTTRRHQQRVLLEARKNASVQKRREFALLIVVRWAWIG